MRESVPFSPSGSVRPAERVLEHLRTEFARPELRRGGRLPTIRALSRRLNVSPATVRNVFQRLAKEGTIRTQVGNGTFLVAPPESGREALVVGVNVAFYRQSPRIGLGYQRIYGGLMEEFLASSRPVTLRALPEEIWKDNEADEVPEELLNLDGIILFPLRFSERLRRQYRGVGRPAVSLNQPASGETVDFASPDYFDAGYRLARCWARAGRKRIVVLVNPLLRKSFAVRQRCAGLVAGFGEALGAGVSVRLVPCEKPFEEDGRRALLSVAREEGFVPDAVHGINDSLAHGALRALAELGVSVADEVSVVAGQGLARGTADGRVLSTMEQPFGPLGAALGRMLLRKMAAGGNEPVPAEILPVRFAPGQTTTAIENDLLQSRD